MLEENGDLWVRWYGGDIIVITTNGTVKKNGEAVMGRGLARRAAKTFPDFPRTLGAMLAKSGNHVYDHGPTHMVTFPVKDAWMEDASLGLIEQSCAELVRLVDYRNWPRIYLPRPGCGNGRLRWSWVKPILLDILKDDRFIVRYERGHD